jgi:hypothetical protein
MTSQLRGVRQLPVAHITRLLGLDDTQWEHFREQIRRGDRRSIPGAVRASPGLNTTDDDLDRLLDAVTAIAAGEPPSVEYEQNPRTGDYMPRGADPSWSDPARSLGAGCARG